MKKWIYIGLIIAAIALLLCFCGDRSLSYPLQQPYEAIVSIEIVEVRDSRIISTGNFDMITTCKTIGPKEHTAFLTTFKKLRCKDSWGPTQHILEGMAVRFTYADGAFEIVGHATGFYCSSRRDWSYPGYYFDPNEFNDFISSILAE